MAHQHPRQHRRTHSRRAAPRALSRESIVDAALRVLDSEGLDAVTMRRVAEELDTGPASLYAHVEHKDDLVEAVLDRVIGEVDVTDEPDPARWEEQLRCFCRNGHAIYRKHRDLAAASLGNVPTGPNALRVVEWLLGVLRAGGVPDQVAAWSGDILALFIAATAYEEAIEEAQHGAAAADYHDEVHGVFTSLDPDRFPNMAALAGVLTSGDRDERFEFGLDMLVRGIASTVENTPRAGR